MGAYTGGEEDREWGRERLLYFSPAKQAITGPTRLSRLGARARQQPTEALQSRQPERYNHPHLARPAKGRRPRSTEQCGPSLVMAHMGGSRSVGRVDRYKTGPNNRDGHFGSGTGMAPARVMD